MVIPHGLYDVGKNKGFVHLNTSHDTSELACDSIAAWWDQEGRADYPLAKKLLVLCDGGGSNSATMYLFKEDLQKLANRLGIEIRVAHYPPYCSKYNPIEHRLFPHLTRACPGVIFHTLETVRYYMAKAKTSKGLKVKVSILERRLRDRPEVCRGLQEDHEDRLRQVPPQMELPGRSRAILKSGSYFSLIPYWVNVPPRLDAKTWLMLLRVLVDNGSDCLRRGLAEAMIGLGSPRSNQGRPGIQLTGEQHHEARDDAAAHGTSRGGHGTPGHIGPDASPVNPDVRAFRRSHTGRVVPRMQAGQLRQVSGRRLGPPALDRRPSRLPERAQARRRGAAPEAARSHHLKPLVMRGQADLGRPESVMSWPSSSATARSGGPLHVPLPRHTGVDKEVAYERLRRAGEIARRHGVVIVLETHPDLGTNGDVHLETMKRINHPNVRVNFDTGNITYYNHGADVVAELKKIVDYVATVELKDHGGEP